MRPPGLKGCGRLGWMVVTTLVLGIPASGTVRAEPPAVTLGPTGVRIRIVSASLSEALDALGRGAGFRVMYEGARPTAWLFNAEIDTPTVPQALFRLLDGQNLNYGVVLDPSGTKVTSVLILGVAPKPGGAAPSAGGARPQGFATPKAPQAEASVAIDDDEPVEEPEPPAPDPSPSPNPSPAEIRPGPPSPFGPRSPFLGPFGPRPTPSASP